MGRGTGSGHVFWSSRASRWSIAVDGLCSRLGPFIRGSDLLRFGMTEFASKLLVCLAAALIPLQPLSAVSCGCDSHGEQGVGDNTCHEQALAESGCCGRTDGGRLSSQSQAGSCCTKTHRAPTKSCCDTSGTCSCRVDDSSPPVPQAPSQSRGYCADDVAQPLAVAPFSPDDDSRYVGFRSTNWSSGASGLARCIVLCRFRL